jgi:hypothetical protein
MTYSLLLRACDTILSMFTLVFCTHEFKSQDAHRQRADIKRSVAHVVVDADPKVEPRKEHSKFHLLSLGGSGPIVTNKTIMAKAITTKPNTICKTVGIT